jgi:hypothetical protein
MLEKDALAECARAMIQRHGSSAAEMAQYLANVHGAIDAQEVANFWNAVAQEVRRILVSGAIEGEDAGCGHRRPLFDALADREK